MLRKTDPSTFQSYLEDSSNLNGGHTEGVYVPTSEAETIEAITECNADNTPLTIHGGGTGTTGGCIAFGGWVLSTEKLNKIIEINVKDKFAIVQPGVTLAEIEAAVAKEGLLYAPDPTEKNATIGGNVATNASGGRGYRFGATRQHIRRLRIVLPSGEVKDIKRGTPANLETLHYTMPAVKNAAGYYSKPGMDLIDLFIGQEGTLGIVSEIEIGLIPALQNTFDIIAFFPNEESAVDFVLETKKHSDPSLNFFEFFDANTLQMLKVSFPHIPANAKAAVYIEQEITSQNENTYLEKWSVLLEKYGAPIDNCWIGLEPSQKEELSKFRHAIPEHINELFKKQHIVKLASDIAVPTVKFKEMYNFYESLLTANGLQQFYIKFGHIGENHLHVNLLPKNESEMATAKELIMQFVKKGLSLGGTVSAEHGIGKIKHPYLLEMYGQKGINEMIDLKKHFDPNLILGRGNIFAISA
ncbi:MAG: FAD-binding oxidoreductase [Candidatus Margulisiibacteriota bacterium]